MADKPRKPRSGWTYQQMVDDIAGVPEIAKALGVDRNRVSVWIYKRRVTNCPKPVRVLAVGSIYSLAEWRGWYSFWKATRKPEQLYFGRNKHMREPSES